jgi:AbrB family looped-hinge helix DNA binding protein
MKRRTFVSTCTLFAKGQITLPIAFRRKLGLKPHDRVVIELEERGILVKPAPDFFKLKGFLGKALPLEREKRLMVKAVAAHVRGGRR